MGPWDVTFIQDSKTGEWRFQAVHANGVLTSSLFDTYATFDEVYAHADELFSLPTDYRTQEQPIKEWLDAHVLMAQEEKASDWVEGDAPVLVQPVLVVDDIAVGELVVDVGALEEV